MNLMDMIAGANNGALVGQMAQQLGIGEGDARRAMGQMLPVLSRGIQRNPSSQQGLESLLGALKGGSHQRYVDHPEEIGRPETVADGNAILGHILGSKDVSRNVAGHAARETGLDSGVLKQMLPMLAAAAMGSLGKQVSGGGSLSGLGGGQSSPSSPAAALLTQFLDADRDGSVADDLIGLAKKFF